MLTVKSKLNVNGVTEEIADHVDCVAISVSGKNDSDMKDKGVPE